MQSETKIEQFARLAVNLAIDINAILYLVHECVVDDFDNLGNDSVLIIFINTPYAPTYLSERLFSAKRRLC